MCVRLSAELILSSHTAAVVAVEYCSLLFSFCETDRQTQFDTGRPREGVGLSTLVGKFYSLGTQHNYDDAKA